jgi:hypothetical protein
VLVSSDGVPYPVIWVVVCSAATGTLVVLVVAGVWVRAGHETTSGPQEVMVTMSVS